MRTRDQKDQKGLGILPYNIRCYQSAESGCRFFQKGVRSVALCLYKNATQRVLVADTSILSRSRCLHSKVVLQWLKDKETYLR